MLWEDKDLLLELNFVNLDFEIFGEILRRICIVYIRFMI